MTRIEDNAVTLKKVTESVNELTNACNRPNNCIRDGEFLMTAAELTKIMILIDISKSLAVIADKLTHE